MSILPTMASLMLTRLPDPTMRRCDDRRRQRYQETDTRDRKRNEELTEEYRRTTKQYNDMQANFRHFEIADNNRYEQVGSAFPQPLGGRACTLMSPPRKFSRADHSLLGESKAISSRSISYLADKSKDRRRCQAKIRSIHS